MRFSFSALASASVTVDAAQVTGPLEWWRHTVGHGGINSEPLPPSVVAGLRRLRPRLVRVFLQEFFAIYAGSGTFAWERMDPYMEALAQTGAKVVADICLKPHALFPAIDHTAWRPTDVAEWQRVIHALVRRYSVEREIVTYWEVGNETDIGEDGGTPFLIPDPADYFEFYAMTIRPILEAFPEAKVGGPAACWVDNEPLPGFIAQCRTSGLPLHFVTWHLYSDDPQQHASGVEKAKVLLSNFPGGRPEMMVTEWSCGFERISVEEQAFNPRRAAVTAASILAFLDAGLDWSFYYHAWDQVCYPEQFQPFFSEKGVANMVRHWNEVPHRFGLFGVGEEVRPQYFVYEMLSRLGDQRLSAQCDQPDLHVLAARNGGSLGVMAINYAVGGTEDCVATIRLSGLDSGRKTLTVYRIDTDRRWSSSDLELLPTERRDVATLGNFEFQVFVPADSVVMVSLEQSG